MEPRIKVVHMNHVRKKFILGIFLIGLITLFFYGFTEDVYQNQESYKEHLIRFHVLANSDSPEDQALKLKVRDKIIQEMNPKFEKSASLDETRSIIEDNLDDIREIALQQIREEGSDYDVKVSLGESIFPTKNYGSITLPAGTYEALRVVIGRGEGANWWCVLFPPLCFIDMEHGMTDDRTKQELMNVLTEEEYNMIRTASSDDEIPVKLKFKVVEILEEARVKWDQMVGMKQ
ncbi:MAG: stage II sporulation protein R [Bacillota bacterium]